MIYRSIRWEQSISFSPLFIGEDSSMQLQSILGVGDAGFQSPLHRGRLFNRFLFPAVSTTCRQNSIRFFATALFAEKPGRFAKTLIECALEPSIRKYPRSSYGIRSPHSDS